MALNKGTINGPSSWPVCEPLDCVCIGYGLTNEQNINVLDTSCPSEDTYDLYEDSLTGDGFIIPNRAHCGTFKPDEPTHESRCKCTEAMDPKYAPRKLKFCK